jgi:hypothetical protein
VCGTNSGKKVILVRADTNLLSTYETEAPIAKLTLQKFDALIQRSPIGNQIYDTHTVCTQLLLTR